MTDESIVRFERCVKFIVLSNGLGARCTSGAADARFDVATFSAVTMFHARLLRVDEIPAS